MLKNWGQSWKRKGFLFKTQTLEQGLLPEVFSSTLLTSSHPPCNIHCGHSRLTCGALVLQGGEVKEKICGIYLMWKCLHPVTTDRRWESVWLIRCLLDFPPPVSDFVFVLVCIDLSFVQITIDLSFVQIPLLCLSPLSGLCYASHPVFWCYRKGRIRQLASRMPHFSFPGSCFKPGAFGSLHRRPGPDLRTQVLPGNNVKAASQACVVIFVV